MAYSCTNLARFQKENRDKGSYYVLSFNLIQAKNDQLYEPVVIRNRTGARTPPGGLIAASPQPFCILTSAENNVNQIDNIHAE